MLAAVVGAAPPSPPSIFSPPPHHSLSTTPRQFLSFTLHSLSSYAYSHNTRLLSTITSLSLSSSNYNDEEEDSEEEEEEEEQVIGDCLVFEDGVFEDPFLQPTNPPLASPSPPPRKATGRTPASAAAIEPENLVPEEWNQVVEEINLSKKDRRKIAQQTEFGQRIFNKKKANSVNLDEYLRFKEYKLSQLKPVVLDNPPQFPPKKLEDDAPSSSSSRVEPKNPRWAVYGRGLDDITDFFNNGSYQPSDDNKPQGRQKFFTKEEKVLMNARIPKLGIATSQKWLPLHTLTASGEFYLVNNLLKYEVDINAADQDGLTALHKAITCKKQAITDYLLRESANPFVRDKDGATLMHYAVQTASSQAIKTLLLHNADINLQDNDGWTPLHLAVQARRNDVVRLLLMKGANKTLKNQDGLTPLELCLHFGRDTKTYELIKLLKYLPRQRR